MFHPLILDRHVLCPEIAPPPIVRIGLSLRPVAPHHVAGCQAGRRSTNPDNRRIYPLREPAFKREAILLRSTV